MKFPVEIAIGSYRWHAHFFFELLAYTAGFQVFLQQRRSHGDPLTSRQRFYVITAAMVGAALGSFLLGHAETRSLVFRGGKTIVGGLVGGLLGVELVKKWLGIQTSTGDLFVLPIAVGTVIGRLGCFFEGLADQTVGLPTALPWGVDFGDGIRRHPTQIYEMVWVIFLAVSLHGWSKRPHRSGELFKAYMVGYLGWRLAIDFLKPRLPFWGLSPIQWICVLTLLYYARTISASMSEKAETVYG